MQRAEGCTEQSVPAVLSMQAARDATYGVSTARTGASFICQWFFAVTIPGWLAGNTMGDVVGHLGDPFLASTEPLQNFYTRGSCAHGRVSPLRFPGIEPAVSPRRWSLRCATSGRPPTHTRPFSRPLPPRQLLCWQQHSSSLGAVTSEAQLSCKRGESAQRKHCNRASARRWDVNGPWVWPRATKRPRTAGGDRCLLGAAQTN